MSTGVVIGDLLAVADVGAVWANADEGARATRSVTGKRRGEMAEAKFLAKASELGFGGGKAVGRQRCVRFYCADERQTVEGSGEVGPCCVERWELQFSSTRALI